jgi:GTPase SAR1 family protein
MKPNTLPATIIREADGGFEGIAAFSLKSILKRDLLQDQQAADNKGRFEMKIAEPAYLQKCREEFLHAVSAWPETVTCEIQILSLPNLASRLQGRLWITFVIKIWSSAEQSIKADIYRHFLETGPLLRAFYPEAEFEPITEQEELNFRVFPCKPEHALMVMRRRESILSATPLKRFSMGFGPVTETSSNSDANAYCFPWHASMDDWSHLLQVLAGQMDPIQIIIRVQRAPHCNSEKPRLEEAIQFCQDYFSTNRSEKSIMADYTRKIQDCMLQQLAEISSAAFNTGVYILSERQIDTSLGNVLGKSITRIYGITVDDAPLAGGFTCQSIPVSKALGSSWLENAEILSIGEAACAFRLPGPPANDLSFLPVRRHRSVPAILPFKYNPEKTDIALFINEHQGIAQPIQMSTEDRMRHMFIVGQTGTGKSTLMESLILQDIQAGKGIAVVDPHGDMVDNVIGKIPDRRLKDVIVLDLLEKDHPLGLNLIEWQEIEDRDIIIDDLYQNLDRIYDMRTTGGPMFEKYFRGMMRLLMGDKPRPGFVPTLLDFINSFESEDFRKWLGKTIDDPGLKKFIKEIERTTGESGLNNVSPYITSKLSRFTEDTRLKRIIGQSHSSLNFESIMRDGKILLMKLGRGRFGPTISALIANQIVSRFKLAAMKRGDMPAEKRREFYLYVDECQTLPPQNFMELLSEARKYRMGIILATQYTAQLTEGTSGANSLLSAIIGNVGSMLIFRLGQLDAELMEQVLKPILSRQDITGLPNFQGYARIQLCNETLLPFSFGTLKDDIPFNNQKARKILKQNSEKYGMDCSEIDQQILNRYYNYRESGNPAENKETPTFDDDEEY